MTGAAKENGIITVVYAAACEDYDGSRKHQLPVCVWTQMSVICARTVISRPNWFRCQENYAVVVVVQWNSDARHCGPARNVVDNSRAQRARAVFASFPTTDLDVTVVPHSAIRPKKKPKPTHTLFKISWPILKKKKEMFLFLGRSYTHPIRRFYTV